MKGEKDRLISDGRVRVGKRIPHGFKSQMEEVFRIPGREMCYPVMS